MTERHKPDLSSIQVIEKSVLRMGEAVAKEAVLVGSAAIYTALSGAARTPNDIDLSVSEAAYRHLREQPGWESKREPESRDGLISNGHIDVAVGWGTQEHKSLLGRSWRLPSDVAIAGLADVYAWKQDRNTNKDKADTAAVRQRLQDPVQPPLPIHTMPFEAAIVKNILPERLQDHPDAPTAAWIAANGLMGVFTLYGHPQIRRANQIIGTLELPEYGVAATYHNGFDLEEDLRVLDRHLEAIQASDTDRLFAMMAEPYTDLVYGNGRESHHPEGEGYDEWLSANLLQAHALMLGLSPKEATRLQRIVLGTTFNETSKKQKGVDDADPLVRAVTGVDLQGLSQPDALVKSCDLAVEDNMSARYSPDRILGKVFAEAGIRISSTEQALAYMSDHPEAYPNGGLPEQTVVKVYAGWLARNANLFDPATGIYVPPYDWSFDRPEIRRRHAIKTREISRRLVTENKHEKITPTESYEIAHEHAEKIASKY